MNAVLPLSGNGKLITYSISDEEWIIVWGKLKFTLKKSCIQIILDEFFMNKDEWYPLGASMDNPMPIGLGIFVRDNFNMLSPRHASAIAAILVNENILTFKGMRPILLETIDENK